MAGPSKLENYFTDLLTTAKQALDDGNRDEAILLFGSLLAESRRLAEAGDAGALAWMAVLTKQLDELLAEVTTLQERLRRWDTLRELGRRRQSAAAEIPAAARMALLHLEAGNVDAAVQHVDRVLALMINNSVTPLEGHGMSIEVPPVGMVYGAFVDVVKDLYYRHERYRDTAALAKRLTVLQPEVPIGWFFLGFSLLRQDLFEDAVEALREVTRLSPDGAGPFIGLASALHRLGRYQEAIKAARRSIELDPNRLNFRLNLVQMLRAVGDNEQALAELDELIELARASPAEDPADPAISRTAYERDMPAHDVADFASLTRLQLLLDLGRPEQVEAAARRLLAAADKPTSAAAHAFLGELRLVAGDHAAAVTHFSEQLDAGILVPQARIGRAAAFASLGELGRAVADLDALAGQGDEHDPKAAIEKLAGLLSGHPGHPLIRKALAHCYLQAWRPSVANALLSELATELPQDWQVRAWLGMAQVTHGADHEDGAEAEAEWNAQISDHRMIMGIRHLTAAVRLAPEEPTPRGELRWLVERAFLRPLITGYLLYVDWEELMQVLPELAEPFRRFRTAEDLDRERKWADAASELRAARSALVEAGLPVLVAYADARLADSLLRLYQVQSALDHLASAEQAMTDVGRLPPSTGTEPSIDEVVERNRRLGHEMAFIDLDHLEFSTAVMQSLNALVSILRAQARHRTGDVSGALEALGDDPVELIDEQLQAGSSFIASYSLAVILRDADRSDELLALLPKLAAHVQPGERHLLANLEATVRLRRNDPGRAIKVLRKALRGTAAGSYEAAVLAENLASAYLQQSRPGKALRLLDRYPLPPTAQLPSVRGRRFLRAEALASSNRFAEALAAYLDGLKMGESFRGHLRAEQARTSWQESQLEYYRRAIHIAIAADRLDTALELVERSKARAFLDQLGLGRLEVSESTTQLRAELSNARQRHVTLTALARSPEPAAEIELLQRLSALGSDLSPGQEVNAENLERELSRERNAMNRLASALAAEHLRHLESVAGPTLSCRQIHALLSGEKRCVLAEYYVTADSTLLFVLTPDAPQPQLYVWDLGSAAIAEQANAFSGVARTTDEAAFHRLADSLIAPLAEHCEPDDVVLLVPHGALHYLPLQAARLEGRTLIERNPVCRAPSASMFVYRLDPPTPPARQWRHALVVGDSRDDLTHSRQEAQAVARRFGTEPLLGTAATKSRLLAELAGKDLIHLACHGRFDTGQPGDSAVLLAPEPVPRDAELTVEDIFQLRVDANLVTLSACQSGVSDTRPGDELIGLSRAVLHAGASSIVVTLWEVDDLSTSLLMNHFYDRVLDGAGLAVALRDAQLCLATLTTRALVAHCERELAALESAGGDRLAVATLRLARAGAMAAAGDLEAATAAYQQAMAGLEAGGVHADRLHTRARRQLYLLNLKAEARPMVDYTVRPFTHPYYWAPFVLIGDWR